MNNLADIQSQIAKLQKQADQIKSKEFVKTVRDIQLKMRAFGIKVEDLQAPVAAGRAARRSKTVDAAGKKPAAKPSAKRAANKLAGVKVPPKYRHADGQSWTGRGLMPRWLATLVAQGRTKEEFLVAS